jgi:metal-responsive CopG/Arc/MetJ family transcriptional regulator
MAKTKIAVRIDQDLVALLEEVARGSGRNESELLREALAQYLKHYRSARSCYDLATALGVIGAAQGLPSDLSTAKRHLAGFGECGRKS